MDPDTQPTQSSSQQPISLHNQIPNQPLMVTPRHSSFSKILLTLLGVLVVFGFVIGAYFFGVKQGSIMNSGKQVMQQVAQAPTLIPSPTINPTANWETYTASAIHMTLKYPESWSREELQDKGLVNGVTVSGIGGSVNITWGLSGAGGGCPLENQKQINFGGQMVVSCETTAQNSNETWSIYRQEEGIAIAVTATANSCSASGCGPQTKEQMQQTLASTKPLILSILSHITFGAQNSVNTSGWKTYTNSLYKYTVHYPADWFDKGDFTTTPAFETEHYLSNENVTYEKLDTKGVYVFIKKILQFVHGNDQNLTAAEYFDTAYKQNAGAVSVQIGGQPAVKYSVNQFKYANVPGDQYAHIFSYAVLVNNRDVYEIDLQGWYDNAVLANQQLFDQIVSTIMFN